jgi:hypothetical protein
MPKYDGYSDEAYNEGLESGGGDLFIPTKDGDPTTTLTIFGRPFMEKLLFKGKGMPPEIWDDDKHSDLMVSDGKGGQKPANPSWQMSLNAYDHEMGRVRILQGGRALQIEYQDKIKEYGKVRDPNDVDVNGEPRKWIDHLAFKVKRTGTGSGTKFIFNLWPNETPPAIEELAAHEHDLRKFSNEARQETAAASSAATPAGYGPGDDLPF